MGHAQRFMGELIHVQPGADGVVVALEAGKVLQVIHQRAQDDACLFPGEALGYSPKHRRQACGIIGPHAE